MKPKKTSLFDVGFAFFLQIAWKCWIVNVEECNYDSYREYYVLLNINRMIVGQHEQISLLYNSTCTAFCAHADNLMINLRSFSAFWCGGQNHWAFHNGLIRPRGPTFLGLCETHVFPKGFASGTWKNKMFPKQKYSCSGFPIGQISQIITSANQSSPIFTSLYPCVQNKSQIRIWTLGYVSPHSHS